MDEPARNEFLVELRPLAQANFAAIAGWTARVGQERVALAAGVNHSQVSRWLSADESGGRGRF